MTPKEKAKELLNKYFKGSDLLYYDLSWIQAKECALIAVDEIYFSLYNYLKNTDELQNADREFNYWESVKKEIEKL